MQTNNLHNQNLTPLKDGRSLSLDMCREYLGKMITLTIDQPLGTIYKNIIYELNYGFIPNTLAPDGKELDGYFLSSTTPLIEATGRCIAIIHRLDDDDDKLVLVKDGEEKTNEEIEQMVNFVEKLYKHTIIR